MPLYVHCGGVNLMNIVIAREGEAYSQSLPALLDTPTCALLLPAPIITPKKGNMVTFVTES